jgi:hypothetical protein
MFVRDTARLTSNSIVRHGWKTITIINIEFVTSQMRILLQTIASAGAEINQSLEKNVDRTELGLELQLILGILFSGTSSKTGGAVEIAGSDLSVCNPGLFCHLDWMGLVASVVATRQLYVAGRGMVDIVDMGIVTSSFNSVIGGSLYNPAADLTGTGAVNVTDIGVEGYFSGA